MNAREIIFCLIGTVSWNNCKHTWRFWRYPPKFIRSVPSIDSNNRRYFSATLFFFKNMRGKRVPAGSRPPLEIIGCEKDVRLLKRRLAFIIASKPHGLEGIRESFSRRKMRVLRETSKSIGVSD
jgi:hypothetical protein